VSDTNSSLCTTLELPASSPIGTGSLRYTQNGWSVKLSTHLQVVPRWRMRRAIPPLSHMSPWRGTQLNAGTTWNITFTFTFTFISIFTYLPKRTLYPAAHYVLAHCGKGVTAVALVGCGHSRHCTHNVNVMYRLSFYHTLLVMWLKHFTSTSETVTQISSIQIILLRDEHPSKLYYISVK
jgi:hypothetical protein